eukprot:241178_1
MSNLNSIKWNGFHEMGLLTWNSEFVDFDPLLFFFSFMPFIGSVIFWRAFTGCRKNNILGKRGKKVEAIIINKTEAGSRNLKWNRVTQLQMKIEYEAYDEFAQQTITIEKILTDIDATLYNAISEGYTVNVIYDPINPFMSDIDDEYFNSHGRARTGCTRNCCVTLFTFLVAVLFVMIPYWILQAAELSWYWVAIIVVLIPMVFMVMSCVSCCVCCRNHDMIAWYKTRNIIKEQRRREQVEKSGKKNKDEYLLMDNVDQFK